MSSRSFWHTLYKRGNKTVILVQFMKVPIPKQISERSFAYWSLKLLMCQDWNIWELPDTIHMFETKTSIIYATQRLASIGSVCKSVVARCPVRDSAETLPVLSEIYLFFFSFFRLITLMRLESAVCRFLPRPFEFAVYWSSYHTLLFSTEINTASLIEVYRNETNNVAAPLGMCEPVWWNCGRRWFEPVR